MVEVYLHCPISLDAVVINYLGTGTNLFLLLPNHVRMFTLPWLSGYYPCFVFGRYRVKILARRQAVSNEALTGFSVPPGINVITTEYLVLPDTLWLWNRCSL
jgi:hypothetical protein